ncbi:MAG: cell division protein SepF [Actinomycetota bacterium]
MANPMRKAMVYLGLADDEFDYDDAAPTAPAAPLERHVERRQDRHAAPAAPSRAQVTPLRRVSAPRPQAPADMNEILTVHPRTYNDAPVISESFRDGIPVIMNLSQMSDPEARRLIDFASGLTEGLYGKIERVTNKVFLLSPSHVAVSGDRAEAEQDVDASFFAQS